MLNFSSKVCKGILLLVFASCRFVVSAQDAQSSLAGLSNAYYDKVIAKTDKFIARVTKYSAKALTKLACQEQRIKRKLEAVDSAEARRLFSTSIDSLQKLKNEVIAKGGPLNQLPPKNYLPYLDSLSTSLNFLKNAGKLPNSNINVGRLEQSIQGLTQINAKIEQAESIHEYISERRKLLFSQLSKYKIFGRELNSINKEVHYYAQALGQYKNLLQDPAKIESVVLGLLLKVPAFNKFFQSNSQLSTLFMSPLATSDPIPIVGGLQPRFAVQQSIISRGYDPGTNVSGLLQQQTQTVQDQLKMLKDKLAGLAKPTEGDVPVIKGNSQKTKLFWNRLEYGANIQFTKAHRFIPSTADMAIQLGYKINDNSSIGTALSYKAGFSVRALNNMSLSHEGLGIRSFIDWKLKGNLYIQGGYEFNHFEQFENITQLRQSDAWQRSALLGLSRKYSISKKLNGSVQFFYDFLYRSHIPQSQPLLFRLGYSLK